MPSRLKPNWSRGGCTLTGLFITVASFVPEERERIVSLTKQVVDSLSNGATHVLPDWKDIIASRYTGRASDLAGNICLNCGITDKVVQSAITELITIRFWHAEISESCRKQNRFAISDTSGMVESYEKLRDIDNQKLVTERLHRALQKLKVHELTPDLVVIYGDRNRGNGLTKFIVDQLDGRIWSDESCPLCSGNIEPDDNIVRLGIESSIRTIVASQRAIGSRRSPQAAFP